MKIGKSSYFAPGIRVISPWKIEIGENSIINSGCLLDGRSGLIIGDNVDISWDAYILTLQHDHDNPEYTAVGAPIHICDRACIATRATILPGVRIGEGAVVAAGAIVTKDIESYDIVAGVPARKIRKRSKFQTYKLVRGSLVN